LILKISLNHLFINQLEKLAFRKLHDSGFNHLDSSRAEFFIINPTILWIDEFPYDRVTQGRCDRPWQGATKAAIIPDFDGAQVEV
jgi:hypothetical protein